MNKKMGDEYKASKFNPRVMLRAVDQYIDKSNFEDLILLKFAPYSDNRADWTQGASVRLV